MSEFQPRGIRNNNPLNIRIGNKWFGEVDNPTDKEFEQFTSMVYGLRAAFILLRRYIKRYGLNTITAIVSRWAPSSENDTWAYIKVVATEMQFSVLDPISFEDKNTMCRLVSAMAYVECGQHVPYDVIAAGYNLACESV